MSIVWSRPSSWRGEPVRLPCGQCVGCRLEKSRQWAVRCMHEASLYEDNCFLTLTYNEKFLPLDGSLHLEHFQLFMKRLRKSVAPKKIRFYHCGEYGEFNGRPHYHALLFNHNFEDRKYYKGDDDRRLYTSDSLSELWPMGFHTIGKVTFESAAYVARYVMKKLTGKHAEVHYDGRAPEYSTMSRRPGIGKAWLERYWSDVYPGDSVVVNGRHTRPPRFYDNALGVKDPSTLALIKLDREMEGWKNRFDNTTDRLLVKEEVKLAQIGNLKREI